MNTAPRTATPNQLHHHLFTPLAWLDLLDEQHLSCTRLHKVLDRNTPTHDTLTQLLHSLDKLDQSLAWQPLLDDTQQAKLLRSLHDRQQQIARLIRQLRPQLKQLLRGDDAIPVPPEALWDRVGALAPQLQEQLIRYLPLLERAFQLQRAMVNDPTAQTPLNAPAIQHPQDYRDQPRPFAAHH